MKISNSTCKKIWQPRLTRIIYFVAPILIIYLALVFLCYLSRGYHEEKIADDYKWNVAPETSECGSVLWEASLMGRGSGQPMKQYSNIWLLENEKTVMYDSSVLSHSNCFSFLTSQMLTIKSKRILVIYDKEKQKELLIIRN